MLERSVIEKCWSSQHRQEMPISAQLFEYDFFRHLHIYCQVILPCLHLRLFWRAKNIAEKMDTNAQWFHSSWSILPQRVNIRVRGFHLVLKNFCWFSSLHLDVLILRPKSFSFGVESPWDLHRFTSDRRWGWLQNHIKKLNEVTKNEPNLPLC